MFESVVASNIFVYSVYKLHSHLHDLHVPRWKIQNEIGRVFTVVSPRTGQIIRETLSLKLAIRLVSLQTSYIL